MIPSNQNGPKSPIDVNTTSDSTGISEIGIRILSTEYFKSPVLDLSPVTSEVDNVDDRSLGRE